MDPQKHACNRLKTKFNVDNLQTQTVFSSPEGITKTNNLHPTFIKF